MKYYGTAETAANRILEAFRNPSGLPKALSNMFIRIPNGHEKPSDRWSWSNQLLMALFGHSDARGFRQWEEVGRKVRKGERSFPILAPMKKTITRKGEDGSESAVTVIFGFKSVPVFGLEQTEGDPVPSGLDSETEAWLGALPFREVAESWGLCVSAFSGARAAYLGYYKHGTAIALGVKNLSTWAHELVHAADDRNGRLSKRPGQQLDNETVAEFGGAILLSVLGLDEAADWGGCWSYIQGYAEREKKDVFKTCLNFLNRTCEAVSLIMETAETLRAESLTLAAA